MDKAVKQQPDKARQREFAFAWMAAFFVVLAFMPRTINDDNFVTLLGALRVYDPALFPQNIALAGGVSPRWVLNAVCAGLMRLTGAGWPELFFGGLFFNGAVLAAAIARMAQSCSRRYSGVVSAVLAVLVCTNACAAIAGFSTYPGHTLGIGTAMATAFLAVSLVMGEKKHYFAAWIVLAVTVCIHVHEGLYGFAVVFLLLLLEVAETRRFSLKAHAGFLLYAACAAAVILPSLASDSSTLSNEEFVGIYAQLRTPHHLVPSAWGAEAYLTCALFFVAAALFWLEALRFYRREALAGAVREILLFFFCGLCALGVTWLFTEVIPLSLMVTVYIPKFFKYMGLLALVWMVRAIALHLENREFAGGIAIGAFALYLNWLVSVTSWRMGWLAFAALFLLSWWWLKAGGRLRGWLGRESVIAVLCFAVLLPAWRVRLGGQRWLWLVLAVLFLARFWGMRRRTVLSRGAVCCAAALLALLGTYNVCFNLQGGQLQAVGPRDWVVRTAGEDLCQLAEQIGQETDKTELFLMDPKSYAGDWLQMLSQRDFYVSYKITPSSKQAISVWYDRYLQTEKLFQRPADEVADIMEQEGITYVLAEWEHYAALEASGRFEAAFLCDGDSCRIYRLRR